MKIFMENFVSEISNVIEERQKLSKQTSLNFSDMEMKLRETEEKLKILSEKEAVP